MPGTSNSATQTSILLQKEARALRNSLRHYLNAAPRLTGYRVELDKNNLGSFYRGVKGLLQRGWFRGNLPPEKSSAPDLASIQDIQNLLTRHLNLVTRMKNANVPIPASLDLPNPETPEYFLLFYPSPRRTRGRQAHDRPWIAEIPEAYFHYLDQGTGPLTALKLVTYVRGQHPQAKIEVKAAEKSIKEVLGFARTLAPRIPAAMTTALNHPLAPPSFLELLPIARKIGDPAPMDARTGIRSRRWPRHPSDRADVEEGVRRWLWLYAFSAFELEDSIGEMKVPYRTVEASIEVAMGWWARGLAQTGDFWG